MTDISSFEVVLGPQNTLLAETPHILIPGRGRDASGDGLSQASSERFILAAALYHAQDELDSDLFTDRRVVPSGYKTPGDKQGAPITLFDPESHQLRRYQGKPEAYSGKLLLEKLGVLPNDISAEIRSIDTVTNFVHAEQGDHFGKGDERPVAIIAQAGHLERMMKVIAPRTLRRDYIRVVVPESTVPDVDSRAARLFSQIISFGLTPNSRFAVHRTDLVAKALWSVALLAQSIHPPKKAYNTDS